jgi:hypothetical protein
MTEPARGQVRLTAALAGRYRIERDLEAGGMATVTWPAISRMTAR